MGSATMASSSIRLTHNFSNTENLVPYEPLKMMRAIHVENFGGPEVLQLKSNLIVPPLTRTQVLVRVVCAGVNPVETYIREGQYAKLPDLPYTPGTDAAGDVERVGKNVSSVKVGDRVFVVGSNISNNTGSYAEFVVT